MAKIGVVGTGIQGTAIVKKLQEAGWTVAVYDHVESQMRKSICMGAMPCYSMHELVRSSEFILLVLPAGSAPIDLLSEHNCRAALREGQVVLQMGTTSVDSALRMDELVRDTGAVFAECVLAGPIVTIMEGECPLIFGGDADLMERIFDMCSSFGKPFHVGGVGKAAAFNLGGLGHVYAIVHGFALGSAMIERSGIDMDIWLDFIKNGIGGHPGDLLVDFLWPAHFENRNYGLLGPVQVSNDGAREEALLIADRARELHLDTKMVHAMHTLHEEAYNKGSAADWTSFFDHLAPVQTLWSTEIQKESLLSGSTAPELAKEATVKLSKMGVYNLIQSLPKNQDSIQVRDAMHVGSPIAHPESTLQEVSALLAQSLYSDIPVITKKGEFLGVVSEGDLIRSVLPDFAEVLAVNPSLSQAATLLQVNANRIKEQPIFGLIITTPIYLHPEQDILSAAVMMIEKMIRRLPVVENGVYLGSLSRADICHCLMNQDEHVVSKNEE